MMGERSAERASPGSMIGKGPAWEPDPFKVLISTVLSQRTRDECTYVASKQLFSVYDEAVKLAYAPLAEVDELIRQVGFHQTKAKAIIQISRMIHEGSNDQVPSDIDSLLNLPMVGRKTANCVLSYAFGQDAICVDTHVHRISNRIGLVHTRTPDETEQALKEVVPQNLWREINKVMVRFGQEVCTPLRPHHDQCPLTAFCDQFRRDHDGNGPSKT